MSRQGSLTGLRSSETLNAITRVPNLTVFGPLKEDAADLVFIPLTVVRASARVVEEMFEEVIECHMAFDRAQLRSQRTALPGLRGIRRWVPVG